MLILLTSTSGAFRDWPCHLFPTMASLDVGQHCNMHLACTHAQPATGLAAGTRLLSVACRPLAFEAWQPLDEHQHRCCLPLSLASRHSRRATYLQHVTREVWIILDLKLTRTETWSFRVGLLSTDRPIEPKPSFEGCLAFSEPAVLLGGCSDRVCSSRMDSFAAYLTSLW